MSDGITFGTLTEEDGLLNVRVIKRSDIMRCPEVILVPSHYREDGSCRCDEKAKAEELAREIVGGE